MDLSSVNLLDAVLGTIVVLSTLIGMGRGLIKEVLSLIAWVVAFIIAQKFADMVAEQYIKQIFNDGFISYIVAFGGIFITVLFAIGLLNLAITTILRAVGANWVDVLFGGILGFIRGGVIATLLILGLSFTNLPREDWFIQSKLAPSFVGYTDWLIEQFPDLVEKFSKNHLQKSNEIKALQQANGVKYPMAGKDLEAKRQTQKPQQPVITLESTQDNTEGQE